MTQAQNEFLPTHCSTLRAVIFRRGQLLVQVKTRPDGSTYLTPPCGCLEPGETMRQCTARECVKEVGVRPEVGPLQHACRDKFLVLGGQYAWFVNQMQLAFLDGSALYVHAGIDDCMCDLLARRHKGDQRVFGPRCWITRLRFTSAHRPTSCVPNSLRRTRH